MPGVLPDSYINAIKDFEGYSPKAFGDYRQYSIGYGTKATAPGETIDRDTAEQRLQTELGNAAQYVDKAFPQLPEGARAALTSLTYNAGPGWINSGLGKAVGAGDWGTARDLFLQYNKAGGQVLPGLVNRRAQEAAWLTGAQTPEMAGVPSPQPPQNNASAGFPVAQGGPSNPFVPGLSAQPGEDLPQIPPAPLMSFAQLRRPQINFAGFQRLLQGRA